MRKQCKKCNVFLSRKNEKRGDGLCNSCRGVGYNPQPSQGRKIMFKKG